MNKQHLETIANGLGAIFEQEPEKIVLWLFTDNLNLGGWSPVKLIQAGRAKKVADFVAGAEHAHSISHDGEEFLGG